MSNDSISSSRVGSATRVTWSRQQLEAVIRRLDVDAERDRREAVRAVARAEEYWTPLMDRLEARTARKINDRREFCRYLGFITRSYFYEKACHEGPTPKELLIAYETMIQHFDAFRADFDGLLGRGTLIVAKPGRSGPFLTALFRDAGAEPDAADELHIEVLKCLKALEPISRIRKDLDWFDRIIHEALGYAREQADNYRRGGKPRFGLKLVILQLGTLYEREIGVPPGVSGEVGDGGPFVAFVRDFLENVDPDASKRSALYKTVKDNLREYRTWGNTTSEETPR